ncbi:MAG: class I SAM-dependent methyltransferase [Actinomycetota bacterium]|nr:class I SAM-dependent methyltransferase [Actinomycetota bacterium]
MNQPVTHLEQQQMRVAAAEGLTFWHRVRFRLVQQAAAASGATTVLDIGAGSGQLGDWLLAQPRPLQYLFEESSAVLDAALAERFGSDHRGVDGAPIASTTLVTMLDVLEHIEHDRAALERIRARMAPGAQLLLTVPAFQWAFTSWDTALGHHRRYSRRRLREVAETAGFRVVSAGYLFPELLPLVAVRKLRRSQREHADFPSLPRLVDRSAELFSRGTTALRRAWPGGTSVVMLVQAGPAGEVRS